MSLADQSQWCPTSVQVTVLQARGLRIKGKNGTNDAYAVMQVAKEKYSTSVAEKSVAPVWKEEATFDLPPLHHGNTERCRLHVHVMHRALVGPDKLLGQAAVNLPELMEDKARNKTEWFKLLDKAGKPDKDRGEVLLDIQFMRNNITASMFDLSATDKPRSRLRKFKDKVRGKKEEGLSDAASAVVPSFTQVLTDSEEEGEGNGYGNRAADKEEKKKKHKLKSLFSPKSNLQKNMSQSMSLLPEKNSSLSGSQSSGLNADSSEGKKKFKFMMHKRSGSSDSKGSQGPPSIHGRPKSGSALAVEQSNLCINGSHVYSEEPQPRSSRTGSNFSLASSGHGSMEDLRRAQVPERSATSTDSHMTLKQHSPWTEDEGSSKTAEEQEMVEEEEMILIEQERRRIEEEEKIRMEELERIRGEERTKEEGKRRQQEERVRKEEERERLAEEKRRLEEQERRRIEEEDNIRREEQERIRMEKERAEEERKRRQEQEERVRKEEEEMERLAEEKRKLEEQERRRIEEEEKIRREEQERIRMEKERAEEERKKRQEQEERVRKEEEERERLAEEKRRLEEQERRRIEEEEKVRREEQEMIKMENERAEEERKRRQEQDERVRKEEEERQRLVEEKKRLEEEERLRKAEELQIKREEEKRIESKRREEEKQRKEEEEKMIKDEEERIERINEEKGKKKEEERLRKEEDRLRREMENKMLEEEKEQLKKEEVNRLRKEKEEGRQREEEERLEMIEEENRLRKDKEVKLEEERLTEEQRTCFEEKRREDEDRKVEEQWKKGMEEQKKARLEEDRRDEGDKRKEEKSLKEENNKKDEQIDVEKSREQNRAALADKPHSSLKVKVAVESSTPFAEVTSTNPFDDISSSNPFEEISSSPAGPLSRTTKVSTVKPRYHSAVLLVGSKEDLSLKDTMRADGKEPASAQRDKRMAPQPPERHGTEKQIQREQNVSTLDLAQRNKQSRHKDVKTSNVVPQRLVQMIAPLSRSSSTTKNAQVLETQSSTHCSNQPECMTSTTGASIAVKHNKGPAPSRPHSSNVGGNILTQVSEDGPCCEPKRALSSDAYRKDSNIPYGHGSVAKQVPVVFGSNPFEDDETEIHLTTQDEMPTSGNAKTMDSHNHQRCPSTNAGLLDLAAAAPHTPDDDNGNSQTKSKSSKVVRAPLPPAKKAATSSILKNESTGLVSKKQHSVTDVAVPDNRANQGDDPQSEAVSTVSDQKTVPLANPLLSETQPVAAQGIGEEAGGKKDGPPSTSRRLHPVKPLNPLDHQSVPVIQGTEENKSLAVLSGIQEKIKVKEAGLKGPYTQLTQEELISLVLKQESQLAERDKKMSELEQYIDNLLVRVIEEKPSILMSIGSLKKDL